MRNQITLKIMLATTLAITLISTFVAAGAWCIDKQRSDTVVSSYRNLTVIQLKNHGATLDYRSILNVRDAEMTVLPSDLALLSIEVRLHSGKVVATATPLPDPTGRQSDGYADDTNSFDIEPFLSPVPSKITITTPVTWLLNGSQHVSAIAQIDIDSTEWKESDGASLLGILKLLFLLTLLAATALGGLIYRWVSKPASAIIHVAHRIAAGDQDLRLAVSENDEFGKIMLAFNDLTDALLTTQKQADTDGLTQLFNHRYLHEKMGEALDTAHKSGGSMAIILLDLDRFKLLNDTYGHLIGDRFLQQTASVLRRAIHLDGIVGRYGGDEFVVVLPLANKDKARSAVRRIRQLMEAEKFRPHPDSETLPISCSIGIAAYPEDGKTAQELVAYADATLYAEKNGGLHLVQFTRDIESEFAVSHTSTPSSPHNGLFATLSSLVVAIDKKDQYTKYHSEHVAQWSARLAKSIGLPDRTIRALKVAGLLHDVGKISIPDGILRKPGPLTTEEYDIMKGHVALAERLIQDVPYQLEVLEAVACHHERWDGKGYPRGLMGTEMPITGRIMALIDAYSAMSLDRPYRRAKTFEEICEQLRAGSGTQFDAELVEPFIDLLRSHGNGHVIETDTEIETFRAWRQSAALSERAVSNA